MNKEELKKKLSKYSKDEIIEGILANSWRYDFGVALLNSLKNLAENKAFEEADRLRGEEIELLDDCIAKQKAYNDYLFEVARKHGIVHKSEKGQDCYKWGDWFDTATEAERDEGLRLERAQKKAFDKWEAIKKKREEAEKKEDLLSND